ncbi:MAG: T9SS type A sorting domain-containing protein, partial [Winogradskyella sp.]|nr:T9SS type A sorting domain-containing protein [Winogradskyella sp.]
KHAFINSQPEWTGNYTSAGVVSINFDVQNTGTKDLSLRIGLQSNNNSRWAVTSVPVVISAGTAWTNVSFNIDEASMFSAGNPAEMVSDILTDVTIIKIFSNDGTISPEYQGDSEVLFSDYDNITASSSLSVTDFIPTGEFTISPNPSRNKLNVKLSSYNESLKLEVFDVLGKKIHMGKVTNLETTVNVSNWKSGVYLVRISNDNVSQTKRFIKL